MRKLVLLLYLAALTTFASAQVSTMDTSSIQPKTIIHLSFIAPGLMIEQMIARSTTLCFNFWSGFAFQYSEVNGRAVSSSKVFPNFTLSPRYYPTLKKRKVIVTRSNYYSGPYFGFPVTIGFNYRRYSVGPVIGFQQGIGHKGFWNLAIGPGISGIMGRIKLGFISEFGLGIVLN